MSQLHTGKISLTTLTFQLHLLSHIMESSCLDVCCFRMQIPFRGGAGNGALVLHTRQLPATDPETDGGILPLPPLRR